MPCFFYRCLYISLMCMVSVFAVAERPEVSIKAGSFTMGNVNGPRDERPARQLDMAAFRLDKSPVTVREFAAFVEATGHRTTAEELGDSAVFDMEQGGWSLVAGTTFRHPLGPEQAPANPDHPVTHVSWFDARAYCEHEGRRLPTEAEFEYAAKSGTPNGNAVYAFGDKIARDGDFLINIYTGKFPFRNTGADGYVYTAPVGATGITPLGLTDMAGNVWEWSEDWYMPYGANADDAEPTEKTQRGGSFLCHESYCHGYRTTARAHSTPDTSAVHVGFRCARDAP